MDIWWKSAPGSGTSKYKGLEVGTGLEGLKSRNELLLGAVEKAGVCERSCRGYAGEAHRIPCRTL